MSDHPKCLALIGLREDEGLAEPCVDNLLALGFSQVVLLCVEEFAAEADALRARFADRPAVSVHELPTTVKDESFLELSGPLLAPLMAEFAPDWLLVMDVDEFPVIRGNHLNGLRALADADSITIQRYNHARRQNQDMQDILNQLRDPGKMDLITEREDAAPDLGSQPGPRWSFHSIGPKVMIRPARFARFIVGAHKAEGWLGEGDGPVIANSPDIVMVHVPFTSYERFAEKVRNARDHMARTKLHSGMRAWHWKWWVKRMEEGGLAEEYNREALSETEYSELRARGAILSAEEILQKGPGT